MGSRTVLTAAVIVALLTTAGVCRAASGSLWGLFVGVDDYRSMGFCDLRYSEADARLVQDRPLTWAYCAQIYHG